MKTAILIICLVSASLMVLSSCGREAGVQPIRIGLTIDESNPVAGEAASRAMARAMEEFLGIPVEAVLDVSYMMGIEAMRAGHLDIMLVSAFNYVHTSSVVDVEILVTLPIMEGAANHAAIITRADRDDINSLEDLEGKTIAFVSAASTMGFIFPKYHLVTELGLTPELVMHSGYFFDTAYFTGGHEVSIIGVGMGDFDAAAVGAMFLDNMEDRGIIYAADFKIIAATAPTPDPAYIIRADIDPELIEQIREFFLTFNDPAYFEENWGDGTIRFRLPDIEAFEYVRSMVRTLGL